MAQRENDAIEPAYGRDHDAESSFVATAREVIPQRETLLDAFDE